MTNIPDKDEVVRSNRIGPIPATPPEITQKSPENAPGSTDAGSGLFAGKEYLTVIIRGVVTGVAENEARPPATITLEPAQLEAVRRAFAHPKLKARARRQTQLKVDQFRLERSAACECCGRQAKTEAHHLDYCNYQHVQWLCKSCHLEQQGADAAMVEAFCQSVGFALQAYYHEIPARFALSPASPHRNEGRGHAL